MALKNLLRRAKELTMSHEARVDEAYRGAVPAVFRGMILAGGAGEAGLVADSLAQLTGQDIRKGSVEEISDLLGVYTAIVSGYLLEGRRLRDIRAELLRRYERFLKADNIGRVTAFCVLHAGDGTFFMTGEDAAAQLAAMEESISET